MQRRADPARLPTHRRAPLLLTAGLIAALLLPAYLHSPTLSASANLLANPTFDPATIEDDWHPDGLAIESTQLRLTTVIGRVHQYIDAAPGARYDASATLSSPQGVTAQLLLEFWNTSGPISAATVVSPVTAVGASETTLVLSAPSAPPGTILTRFVIEVRGATGTSLRFSTASLTESPGAPTPTPTPTPTASPTPTPTPTPANQPPAEPSSTPTPKPPKTPTPTKTPTPPRQRTPPPTPTLPPTATPTPPPASSRGLLRNGDFETVQSGRPAYWSKVGGELRTSTQAYSGRYSACLDSDTASTKWLYQAVQVEPEEWYEATAWASASGGETFLRVTWYTTADGSGAGTEQADSQPATGDWTYLFTGPIQAPVDARSARVRLMLRPVATATACFDDVMFDHVQPPPPTPTPTPKPTATPSTASTPATRQSTTAATPRPPAAPSPGTPTQSGLYPEPPPSSSLRISEILADPPEPGRDAPYEWVEIVNISSQPIDLAGWTIGDATAADILPALLLPPGAYAVIAGSSAHLPPGIAIVRVTDGQIGNGIGNTGDLLRLRDPAGRTIDELSFGTRTDIFDPAPPAPEAGETLGLRDPLADPSPENWAITLEPTPGQPNRFPSRAGAAATSSQPAHASDGIASRSATLLQIETDDGSGSVLPWMVLGGLAGIAVGMLGTALARLHRRLRQRPPPTAPPTNGPDA